LFCREKKKEKEEEEEAFVLELFNGKLGDRIRVWAG
jgi:hypothetical protein